MKTRTQKLDLLIALYITCLLISELMGMKTFHLVKIFGYQLTASVAIFTFPVIFTINDIIIEVYGKERIRSIIRSGLIMIAFLVLFSLFATQISPSSRFASSEASYDHIFYKSIRISIASLSAFALSEFLDVLVFTKLRKQLGKSKLWLRNNASNFVAQFFDTSIFMVLAFYAINESFAGNMEFLVGLIVPYWLLKCLMSVLETPFLYIGIKWLKN
ncbi:queuosine precursor transporter [Candidatus Dojkabacteria bacterium]|nr:queuosine precursor transporter [Candidatus Dojkabacteria bacterium]